MLRWNCHVCGCKLITRKERLLKTCNKCSLQARNILTNTGLSSKDKFFSLVAMELSGKMSRKDKNLLVRTLSDNVKKLDVFKEWHLKEYSSSVVRDELLSFDLDQEFVNGVVRDYKIFLGEVL